MGWFVGYLYRNVISGGDGCGGNGSRCCGDGGSVVPRCLPLSISAMSDGW